MRRQTPAIAVLGGGLIAESAARALGPRVTLVKSIGKAKLVLCTDADAARQCADARVAMIAASSDAREAIVGPTVIPGETACYRCYEMRAIPREAVPQSPAAASASNARIAGELLALEALRVLTGALPAARNAILVFDAAASTLTSYRVLRHPDCPVCFPHALPHSLPHALLR